MEGYVKWFDSTKGWGFVCGQDDVDYFAHYSQIEGSGYRNLDQDEEVEFDLEKDNKGRYRAVNIKKLEVRQ